MPDPLENSAVIVGVDEAGRGALAGPVVAGACLLDPQLEKHPLIADSKSLSPEKREEAFSWIEKNCTYGYGIVAGSEVDTNGILACTEKAMHAALAMVEKHVTPTYLLIDGRDKFWFNYPKSGVIKGDETEPCISAGSIVAKVLRDRMMVEYAKQYPKYGFEEHKGYGAPQHIEALEMFGVCPLHRNTFLRNFDVAQPSKS
ncbi:MAG: ribonuclease HII [Candidatus Peribacter sp.]|jgi:ribonuclease HII|nr:ribonuclease HII [Candidatus Peribacter sp.]MBT4393524.1 ribonuclease HII [Candidatus Peribacter sp.]MBT4601259.1 ribonuclease HII [Candidatus Peribacter sp.]MBT5149308.1 ribonuclease HII [Candidatus Peribacter sp.]MBT5638265.1 ribonuclease HII [Candidatus Peribacter sp.]